MRSDRRTIRPTAPGPGSIRPAVGWVACPGRGRGRGRAWQSVVQCHLSAEDRFWRPREHGTLQPAAPQEKTNTLLCHRARHGPSLPRPSVVCSSGAGAGVEAGRAGRATFRPDPPRTTASAAAAYLARAQSRFRTAIPFMQIVLIKSLRGTALSPCSWSNRGVGVVEQRRRVAAAAATGVICLTVGLSRSRSPGRSQTVMVVRRLADRPDRVSGQLVRRRWARPAQPAARNKWRRSHKDLKSRR